MISNRCTIDDTEYYYIGGGEVGRTSFKKLSDVLEAQGKRWQVLREAGISPGIVDKLKKDKEHIDTRTIDKICEVLEIQPKDFMEYIPYKTAAAEEGSKANE